jgi:tetraacyldisaccharide 4'-kinase
MNRDALLERLWYQGHPLSPALAPLGWIYAGMMRLRRGAYRAGVLPSTRLAVPVIIAGNLAVGGTGKTPLVVWLAGFLASRGWRPGIVCRGHGGNASHWPQQVRPDSDAVVVGDEAVLLARRTGCPVVAAGPRRVQAAREVIDRAGCDLVISDDGLQHLALARDVEILVVDGVRRHGNGRCLPAGPLREPRSRMETVDMVVSNGDARRGEFPMTIVPGPLVNLLRAENRRTLQSLAGQRVHAVCGIGNPQRFFRLLEDRGLIVDAHAFDDHHRFTASDLDFLDDAPVVMTEKDAVKCQRFAAPHHWYLPITAELPDAFCARLERLLDDPGEAP